MREKKVCKVQVRITPKEKGILDKLREVDSNMTASRLFREALAKSAEDHNLMSNTIGKFIIG